MRDDFVHSSGNLFGFLLYLAAAVLLIAALTSAYRSRLNGVEAVALAGAALAAGCTCCLTPGAVRYSVLQTGLVPGWMVSRLALALAAAVIGGGALYKARGSKAFLWFAAGILLVYPVEKLVEWAAPTWSVSGANLTFLLRYPVWLAGTACVMYAASRVFAQPDAGPAPPSGSFV